MLATITRCLALAATLAAGDAAAAEVKVYQLPEGAGPHDVAPAPDGKVWYSAQGSGALGIVDPATGEVRQVALGEGSAPHGVIQGPDGAAWLTDGGLNAIVRVDPRTEEVKAWRLPEDAGYANLNTATFDGKGTLWFTGQAGIYGRLDPATGSMRVWKDPDGRGPYGITTTPGGRVFYASLAGSHIAEIDTATGEKRRIDPPTAGQGARRVWADSKGDIWVSEWNSGQLSRYTPANGAWKAWRLPGDTPRAYAVYVDGADTVWVSDFAANAVLNFDPATERFTATYPGSGPNANVRQILGREGEVFLPESGLDRVVVVHAGAARAAGN
jgi:virginiamycin B lyase